MTKNKKGFTIIEVVLVLAIAGLIFLMVFIALPALQRSQRNTQRKDDLARFITAITEYKSNNGNKNPFDGDTDALVSRYIKGDGGDAQFRDPDGSDYNFQVLGEADAKKDKDKDSRTLFTQNKITDDLVTHNVIVVKKAGCGQTEGTYRYSAGASDVALFYVAEGKQVLCNDNH